MSAQVTRSIQFLVPLVLLLPVTGQADATAPTWDIMNPPGESREVDINTNEGTWMGVDVSPDGQTIVFELLGDIYLIPIEGGDARSIASGHAWEMQPRFSPDGTRSRLPATGAARTTSG